jgi:hypothetical protein
MQVNIPIMSVNMASTTSGPTSAINDVDLTDVLFAKDPSFTGVAEISDKIIDPVGLDIPTIMYETAEEAVKLDSFSEEIRPFIVDIFVKKFPSVVSLHSLDAGDLSRTLGFTQLRLRKGESLPRSKRIFHISPSEQTHLRDILDLLLKFNFIRRAPMTPNGAHLYGMASYLVPRAKPDSLGRLIVDFSPINQLIESPPNIVPELSASLQQLQGKAYFSSLDLRYAYLGLRIDEESKPLTTFLTPSGSYQWLSLPTGAANSPAHFIEAADKILHHKPVLDDKGNPVFETENVVMLERDPLEGVFNYFDDIIISSKAQQTYAECLKEHFKILEKAVQRLCFHGAKISVPKCDFGKSKITF